WELRTRRNRLFASLAAVNHSIVSCTRCPRLRAYCRRVARDKKREFRDWQYWGKPVPGFGDRDARLLVVGLAPAAHGANRTGRMFTGDSSGSWLYEVLYRHGFANQPHSLSRDDGLQLTDCYITAAARCAPPKNKPSRVELDRCRPYLAAELRLLRRVRVVVTLGRIAHEGFLKAAGWWERLTPPLLRPRHNRLQHFPVGSITGGIPMRRWLLAAALVVGAACDTQREAAAPQRTVDPALTAALVTATASDRLVVIVNYDETVTTSDAMSAAIMNVGSGVIQFRNLDLVAALATPAEITAIGALPGVQGVYANKQLTWETAMLHESVPTIRADAVQASGITGKGIGIAILDSGIDGLYNPDLHYPDKTVQNVKVLF